MKKTFSPKSRVVRVFISSTFRDMQEERDELAKVVFFELKAFCRERGIEFVEVDLRWGVTEAQTQHGETLRLCLEEIKNCRPYFISLLGERYGWVPKVSEDDREAYPWIEERQNCSLTELEIMHGVLNDPELAACSYFYFRDPTFAKGRGEDFTSENPWAAKKLLALKERIRQSGQSLLENYPDPKTVAKQIGEHLRAAITTEYPNEEPADPLDREAEDHEAFAAARQRVYIGREKYYQRLESFVAAEIPEGQTSIALLVTGESGGGKSALLANWARLRRESHPQEFLLLHFIGSTPASSDYNALLQRAMGELKRRFELKDELPSDSKYIVQAFPIWLSMASAKAGASKIILVLDGLNQLVTHDAAPELGWLPKIFPANVRVVVSTLPGISLEAIGRRPHEEMRIELLVETERKELIEKYLSQFSKQLDEPRKDRITSAPACANPLYLRVLLEELRMIGLHEQLSERIAYYLKAENIEDLYQMVLERLEIDYDPVRRGVWIPPEGFSQGMVAEALSMIWAARSGLSESELLELLGKPPRAAWSPLYLALKENLIERRGVLNFIHEYLRQAVENRYLAKSERQKEVRLKLGDFFEKLLKSERTTQGSNLNPHALEELPWLWRMTEEWQNLYDLLADLQVFKVLMQSDEHEVKMSWAAVETKSELRKISAYRKVLESPGNYPNVTFSLSKLLFETGEWDEAQRLTGYQVKKNIGQK